GFRPPTTSSRSRASGARPRRRAAGTPSSTCPPATTTPTPSAQRGAASAPTPPPQQRAGPATPPPGGGPSPSATPPAARWAAPRPGESGAGHQPRDTPTSHTYWTAGIYTATLTVSDGFSQAVDTVTVTVNPRDVEPFDFKDNFDRDDSASLGNGWAEAQGDMTISGDHMVNAALKDTHIAIHPSVIGTVQKVKADFVSVDNDSKPHFGIVVRFQDAKNYYLAYRFTSTSTSSTSNGLRLSKIVDGTETVLAQV